MVHCSWHFRAEPIWLAKSVAGTVMYGFLALASGYLASGLIRGEGYPTVRFKASFDLLHSAFALASIVDLWPPQSFFSTTMLVIFVPYFVISAICGTRDVTRTIWPD
jgi:hypothetical protein